MYEWYCRGEETLYFEESPPEQAISKTRVGETKFPTSLNRRLSRGRDVTTAYAKDACLALENEIQVPR